MTASESVPKGPARGIYPAMATPFSNDELDTGALERNLSILSKTALAGFVLMGSNGETRALSTKEKNRILEVGSVFAGGERALIGGVAEESTELTLERIQMMEKAGFDFALVLPPHYFASRMNGDALLKFYRRVGDASSLPIMIYNAPQFSAGVAIPPPVVAELATYPNVVGLKDSAPAGPASYLAALEGIEDFYVFAGSATNILSSLMLGGEGAVLAVANFAPDLCCACMEAFEAGDLETARKRQLRLIRLNNEIIAAFGPGGLKAAANLRGLKTGQPRHPLSMPSAEEIDQIARTLEREGVAEPLG